MKLTFKEWQTKNYYTKINFMLKLEKNILSGLEKP